MADKHLGEPAWKAFAKGRNYNDAALLKALADWGRSQQDPPALQLKALDALHKQADALAKAYKGDKELAAWLAEMDKAAGSARKAAEQAAASSDSADDDSPAALTTKLVPLLRQVAKGDTLQAMVATTGKLTAVMLSRRAVSPGQRALLAQQLHATGGVKYLIGHCMLEQKAHTFVLQAPVAGLAKKLKLALLEQTGLRLKVRCRGEDGDDDTEADDEDSDSDSGTNSDDAQGGAAAGSGAAGTDPAAAFKARMTALLPQLKQALADGSAAAQQAKLKASEAGVAANKNDHVGANALLDDAQALLRGAAGSAPAPAPADPVKTFTARLAALLPDIKAHPTAKSGDKTVGVLSAEAGALAREKDFAQALALLDAIEAALHQTRPPAPGLSLVELGKARLAWDTTRGHARQELLRLKALLHDEYHDDPDEQATLAGVTSELDTMVAQLNDELGQRLDAVLNADAAQRAGPAAAARQSLDRFVQFINADAVLKEIDGNEYAPDMQVAAPLRTRLAEIRSALGAAP